ncbi:MAG: STAS domain-containing protein [Bacteroidales bacterium]|nr:STAS domain-containing protein [Bacteroidales bacterium]
MSNFTTLSKDGYSVIVMNSDSLDTQTTAELRSELVLLAGGGVKDMVLDLSHCHYCDTAGLSAILIAHRLCKDGHLVLSGVSEEVGNMLSIQRFDPELIIESNLSDAEQKMNTIIAAQ